MSTLKVSTISPLGTDATKTITLGESGGTLGIASGAKTSGFGKIGQVVTATGNSQSATTSSSFSDVPNLSVSITPTSTSSKIYIVVTDVAEVASSGEAAFTIARDGTNLAGNSGMSYVTGSSLQIPIAMSVLDSPSKNSATVYTAQFRVIAGGSINSQTNGVKASITAMEILD
jgi:hypothetical protein